MFRPHMYLMPIPGHEFDSATTPRKDRYSSAGVDLFNIKAEVIPPFEKNIVGTGVQCLIPHSHFLKIYDCSSFPRKYNAFVLSGIIDPDYQGELMVVLQNPTPKPIEIPRATKIAQMILHRVETPEPFLFSSFIRNHISQRTERLRSGFGVSDTRSLQRPIDLRTDARLSSTGDERSACGPSGEANGVEEEKAGRPA